MLDKITREARDGDLKRALRLCMELGGETGSEALRGWASLELFGYRGDEELPEYRKAYAPLQVDGFAGAMHVTGQTISRFLLPDFARDSITEEVLFVQSAPQLIELANEAKGDGVLRLMPPGAADLVTYMNYKSDNPYRQVERLYWTVNRGVVLGIIEDIRSRLVALVAEMRVGMEPGEKLPSAEVADQAVEVAVHGDRSRVKVTQKGSKVTVAHGDRKGWFRNTLEMLAWVAGISGALALLILNWDRLFG